VSKVRFIQNGGRVLMLVDDKLSADLPWRAADVVAKALLSVSRLAEEWDDAERLAIDSAILLRAGVGFGLTDHPRIAGEARKEAVSNRQLRRYMPGGVKSREQFGKPSVANVGAKLWQPFKK
jgi:hypothetical protein